MRPERALVGIPHVVADAVTDPFLVGLCLGAVCGGLLGFTVAWAWKR